MAIKFVSAEFLGTDTPERVNKCRELALEAHVLATNASNPEMRANYLELTRQWNLLADEIEHLEKIETAITPLSRGAASSR